MGKVVAGSRLVILGAAYREDVGDTRYSGSELIVRKLAEMGGDMAAHDPYVALVEAARATDVKLTMVAGRILYRDGAWSTLDPERVVAEARAEALGLMRRAEPA